MDEFYPAHGATDADAWRSVGGGVLVPREISPRNDRLYGERMDAGLTQQQLARVCGVSRQSINSYERLKASPSPDTGQRIAYVLSLYTGKVLRYSDLFLDDAA